MKHEGSSIDLAGAWGVRLDRNDEGVAAQWFKQPFTDTIHLPGSLQAQGYGDEVTLDSPWTGNIVDRALFDDPRYAPYREPDNIKYPCWLNPERVYVGAAWYQREIEIPAAWAGQRLLLTLERPHWATRLWIDDQEIGTQLSLTTPHVYELGTTLPPGQHRLTLRIDNRMIINVGANAHSMSDHTQSNWNGVIGRLELATASPVWLRDVQLFPDVAQKVLKVKVDIDSLLRVPLRGTVTMAATAYNTTTPHHCAPVAYPIELAALGGLAQLDLATAGGHLDVELPLGEAAQCWDEFNPVLYQLTVDLDVAAAGQQWQDRRVVSFGLREVGVVGTQIAVNGRPTFLRGTLECCIFPRTGYPPTAVDAWKRIIHICKAHGLNHIRFHSWCPPEAAFVAADELGFYYQVECPTWPNQGATIGEGRPLDRWLYEEGARIMAAYGNHPSFLLFAHGNEPSGRHVEYLRLWVSYWRKRDGRRLYTSGAGWPAIPENDYHNIPEPRIQHWGEGLGSRINALPPETRMTYRAYVERDLDPTDGQYNRLAALPPAPLISHEIGQWCVYPNFAEMAKYTGVLKPKNFEIFRDFLEANGMGDQAHDFLLASGKLQALCYKEEIEAALRTPGFGGFHLLDLHDFPGQGSALVGVLDPFWDEKGYITAAEFHRFCGDTVPLALMDKRTWRGDETFRADIRIAHFGAQPLADAVIDWRLCDANGVTVKAGALPPQTIAIGNDGLQGQVSFSCADLPPAQRYTLVVGLTAAALGETPRVENDWDLWLFAPTLPALPAPAEEILICAQLDTAVLARLQAGGKVLLTPPADRVKTDCQLGFSTVFWNTAWTRGQAPHTLGILCDPTHPVFAEFPTEYHSNWQWWELIHGAAAMILNDLPQPLRPLVQPIDTWFEARRLGLLFEAQVAGGQLMVCAMDLQTQLDARPVARQLRHSLLTYMASAQFAPTIAVTDAQIQGLFV